MLRYNNNCKKIYKKNQTNLMAFKTKNNPEDNAKTKLNNKK